LRIVSLVLLGGCSSWFTSSPPPPEWAPDPAPVFEVDDQGVALARQAPPPKEAPQRMVRIPAARFQMGCDVHLQDHCDDEAQPPHEVTLTRSYYLMATEVTQGLYAAVTGETPSRGPSCPTCPVNSITWVQMAAFANALSARDGLAPAYTLEGETVTWDRSAPGYRLPTEAEWEWAARADDVTVFAGGDTLDDVGWYAANSPGGAQPVATKQPNRFGLYDLTGNVAELVWDGRRFYADGALVDPVTGHDEPYRMVRGGGWADSAVACQATRRGWVPLTFLDVMAGFRLARNAAPTDALVVEIP